MVESDVGFFVWLSFVLFWFLGVPGLSCSTQDLQFLLQHVGSLVMALRIFYLLPVGSSSPTRDGTQAPCIRSAES